jgi:dienelactone hydrolase
MSQSSDCCPPGSHEAPVLLNDADAAPRGSLLTLGASTPCYYAAPSTETSRAGIVVYTDVWGFQSRIRTLCDSLAEHGNLHVLCVDCFRGQTNADHAHDFVSWIQSTPYDPLVANDTRLCLDYLESKHGVTNNVGTIGFCWGAWAIGKSSVAGIPWKVAVALHPSFKIERVAFQGDDVKLMQQISCPLLMLPAANDAEYTKPHSAELVGIVERGGKSILFRDMLHGWTTRGDMSNKNIERDVKEALRQTLEFLVQHLK